MVGIPLAITLSLIVVSPAMSAPQAEAEHPIFRAVASWDVAAVKKILDTAPAALNVRNADLKTPLRYLSGLEKMTIGGFTPNFSGTAERRVAGYLPVAELLIARGADLNARDKDDSTALNFAATLPFQ